MHGQGNRKSSSLPFADSPYPWVMRLVTLNVLAFLLQLVFQNSPLGNMVTQLLILHPPLVAKGMIWQLLSYMFIHGGLMHILFNMFLLWMMGREVEVVLGSRAFLRLYFFSGLVAGLFSMTMWNASILGASGAVLGILAAYGRLFPDRIILAFMVIPMRVKYFIWFIAVLDLYGAIQGTGNIAHLAHIGGLLTGLVMMKMGWHRKSILGIEERRRQREISKQKTDRNRVNAILDKVNREGIHSLTRNEKAFLESMRKRH
ncbi:MAG: rhomboid family intramembrane serine protease [Candidatus Krumholzibacteria bacterium]|jgi:membrane associated rhomboid family serine protease|nr:rhomboid family intramembrane serine protease [Candidatus Krumholzibacteria bacterium]MDP6797473.1 rhomboid family intramembrane serine protease [Candidatus Krumholzibacteria bacterium]MDP7021007.1 rhomboid family intramembrane serine protease [Candidatus Krumholzibacteria bacterium]